MQTMKVTSIITRQLVTFHMYMRTREKLTAFAELESALGAGLRVRKSNGNVSFVGLAGLEYEQYGSHAYRTEQPWVGRGPYPLAGRLRDPSRKDRDGFDLISDRLRYAPIWYTGPDAIRYAVAYAKYRSRSRAHRVIIRVFNEGDTT